MLNAIEEHLTDDSVELSLEFLSEVFLRVVIRNLSDLLMFVSFLHFRQFLLQLLPLKEQVLLYLLALAFLVSNLFGLFGNLRFEISCPGFFITVYLPGCLLDAFCLIFMKERLFLGCGL